MNDEQLIQEKVREISLVADQFPGVVIVHNVHNEFGKVEFISALGTRKLGLSVDTIRELGTEYHKRFFNEEDAKDYVPKMYDMIQRNNPEEIFSFFQQVRASEQHNWEWYISTIKILLQGTNGLPLLSITFAVPIDPLHHVTNKVSRLLDENNFLRTHFDKFAELSEREKQVAGFAAKGMANDEIARTLHLSINTVKTHRKNINRKLKISSVMELQEYARAFDLI